MDREGVLRAIEGLVAKFLDDILHAHSTGKAFQGPSLALPNRTSWDNVWVSEDMGYRTNNDREQTTTTVRFSAERTGRRLAVLLRLLKHIYRLVQRNIITTKRDLYYGDVALFGRQSVVDVAVDDLSALLGTTRIGLGVVASPKGLVCGDLTLVMKDGTEQIFGSSGMLIPVDTRELQGIRSSAQFVVVVEKETVFRHLTDSGFTERFPALLITGKGYPDLATRSFLRLVWQHLHVPVHVLCDYDPYGVEIMLTYKYGSRGLAHEQVGIPPSVVNWVGIRSSDMIRYGIPKECRIPLTPRDKNRAESILRLPFMRTENEYYREVQGMVDGGYKVEVEALCAVSLFMLVDVYFPDKFGTLQAIVST